MQGQDKGSVSGEGVERSLDVGAVLFHNNHLQGGRAVAKYCRICESGLAGAYQETEARVALGRGHGVATGDGTDKKGDPSPSSGDGAGSRRAENPVLAEERPV